MPSFLDFALRRDRGKKSATPPGSQNDSRDDASVTSRCTSRTSDHCSSAPSREQIFAEKSVHTDRHDHLYNHHRTFHPHQSPVPPAIQASQSSSDETCASACDENKFTNYFQIQTASASFRDDCFCLTRTQKVVVTLDGLKSRRPIVNLKTELGLDNTDFH